MNIKCYIFGHKWSFPMNSLSSDWIKKQIKQKKSSVPQYKCIRCNRLRDGTELTDYGNPLTRGGWRKKT